MIIKTEGITKDEFNRNYEIVGNSDGNYEEVIKFLKWAIESRNTDNKKHIIKAIQILSDRFGIQVTTKFLKGLVDNRKNKNQRITYRVKKAGLNYSRIIRNYTEMVNSISNKPKTTYKIQNGKYITVKETPMTIGMFSKARKKEILKKLILPEEFKKKQERLKEIIEEAQKKRSALEQAEIADREETDEIEDTGKYMETNCPNCNGILKFPLTPNIDTDKYEKLAYGIYTAVLKDMEDGIYYCQNCEKPLRESEGWIDTEIVEFINKQKGTFQFSSKAFCEFCRTDKKNVSIGYVKNKISELCPNTEVKQKENMIMVKVC